MKQRQYPVFLAKSGFSLVELLICLAILAILMTAILSSFTSTMQRSAQQSSIAETQIETDVGLELLRADLEHAGFGLPWQLPAVPSPYLEPAPLADVSNIPKAIISEDTSGSSLNTSDYLVVRATNAIRGGSAQKWGYVGRDNNHNVIVQSLSDDLFTNNEGVIVLRPEVSSGVYRQLIMKGTGYIAKVKNQAVPLSLTLEDQDFAPPPTPNDPDGERFLVYGLNDDVNVRRPFNRTDYYINNTNIPTHCAPQTGVLVKATVNQADDNFFIMPIVDCVADFQVVYYLDTNGDGGWDQRANASSLSGLSAEQIRDQVKAVHCYILAHEGAVDRSFAYSNATINVGDVDTAGTTLLAGRSFDLSATIGGNWANYRWKVYSLAVVPKNLH